MSNKLGMECSACGRSIQFDQLRCEACGHDMLPEDIARHLPQVPTAAVLESEFLGVVLEAKERLATGVPVFQHEARLVLASEAITRARWRIFPLLPALVVLARRPRPDVSTATVLESSQDAARLSLATETMRRARWRVFPLLAAFIVLATLFLLTGL